MGGVAKKVGKVAKYVAPISYIGAKGAQLLASKKNPVTGLAKDYMGGGDSSNSGDSAPFTIDPEQIAFDKQSILTSGTNNSNAILGEAATQKQLLDQRRSEMAKVLSGIADKSFVREIPNIAEDSNASGIYTGTGYSEALAKERARNTADVQDKLALQGLDDVNNELGLRKVALDTRTGAETNSLSRGFSLKDFIRQANVAKSIGAQMAPQVGNGKGGMVQGGATGAAAGAPFGPWGALIGGAGGALLSAQKKGK